MLSDFATVFRWRGALIMHHLDYEGDEGLQNLIGCGYVKYPSVAHVKYFRSKENTGAISSRLNEAASNAADFSPVRKSLRNRAAEKLEKKASQMRDNAVKRMGKDGEKVFAVGEIVQVPLSDVDVSKVDNKTLTGVIVQVNPGNMTARVVVKAGLLESWYQYHNLGRVVGIGANLKLLGLEEAYFGWGTMKLVSERAAARAESLVGGQGRGTVTCVCKGECNTNKCKCFKAGRICTSACHRNNHKCCSRDHDKP